MSNLILIKHSEPRVGEPPASGWHLSPRGRQRCAALANRLIPWGPTILISSTEPKAVETAEVVAGRLAVPWERAGDLHEHDRANVGVLAPSEFDAAVAGLFARPEDLVFGRETAAQATTRFSGAIDGLLESRPGETVAVVTHGTVISLFAHARSGVEPYRLWRRLGLPSFVVFRLPGFELIEVAASVG